MPPEYAAVVERALRKNPDDRFPSAEAMERELLTLIAKESPPPRKLGEYLSELFPEETDQDRMLTRAILSGELRQQRTPSFTNVSVIAQTISKEIPQAPPAARSRTTLVIGIALAMILVTCGIVLEKFRASPATASAKVTEPVALAPVEPPKPEVVPEALPPPAPVVTPPVVVVEAAGGTAGGPARAHVKESKAARHRAEHGGAISHAAPHETALPAPPPVEPRPTGSPGMLAVRVAPWAEVYLDGQRLGTTPFEPVSVPSGSHHLRLVNDEIHATKDMTIEIRPGEVALVKQKLQ